MALALFWLPPQCLEAAMGVGRCAGRGVEPDFEDFDGESCVRGFIIPLLTRLTLDLPDFFVGSPEVAPEFDAGCDGIVLDCSCAISGFLIDDSGACNTATGTGVFAFLERSLPYNARAV